MFRTFGADGVQTGDHQPPNRTRGWKHYAGLGKVYEAIILGAAAEEPSLLLLRVLVSNDNKPKVEVFGKLDG